MTFLSGLALLDLSSGCASLASHTYDDSVAGPYPGVRLDIQSAAAAIKSDPDYCVQSIIPFGIIEIALSAALDTVLLPIDLFQHQPEPRIGLPGVRKYVVQYPHTVDQVLKAARTVLKKHGSIERESKIKAGNTVRTIEGRVNKTVVWMGVEEISPGVTQLSMQALGSMGGIDRELKHQLDEEIAFELTKEPGIYFFQTVSAPEFRSGK